jgi:hypothetical protein
MTTPNPLEAALVALRAEVAKAEAHLKSLADASAPLAAQIEAAGTAYAARLRAEQGEAALPAAAQARRTDVAAAALAGLFGDDVEDQAQEPASTPPTDDDPTGLAALFNA